MSILNYVMKNFILSYDKAENRWAERVSPAAFTRQVTSINFLSLLHAISVLILTNFSSSPRIMVASTPTLVVKPSTLLGSRVLPLTLG